MITKVLIAVDGTDSGNKALDFGLDLAEKYGASVLILNILDIPVFGIPEDPMALSANSASFINDLRKVHGTILTKAIERATSIKPNVAVKMELREGNPHEQIVLTAVEGSFDVIVIGHGAESRVRQMFLGRTSERVAHVAKCAVLIVK